MAATRLFQHGLYVAQLVRSRAHEGGRQQRGQHSYRDPHAGSAFCACGKNWTRYHNAAYYQVSP